MMVLRLCAGNDNINLLTSNARQNLRIELSDFDDKSTFSEYDTFRVGSEKENYKIWTVGTYSGPAG